MNASVGLPGGLTGKAVGEITRLIRERELGPGDRLPSESALARDLAVSRTVVREAFRSLAAVRILELSAGRRATVAPIDHGAVSLILEHGVHTDQISIQQIYDVRRTIESRIAALAALRRREDEAEEIAREAAAMRASTDEPEKLLTHDLAFHRRLAQASRNPVFALLVGAFEGIIAQTWPIGWKARTAAKDREAMIVNHEEIAAAVLEGDPERAVRGMERHFDDSVRALISAGVT